MEIITPQLLWENYDRHTDTGVAELSVLENERRLFFNGCHAGEAVVRVYSRLILPKGIENPPVIIVAAGADRDIESINADFFTSKGMAVLIVDYFGKAADKSRYTIYPKAIDAFWEQEPKKIKLPPEDPKKSCWYYWTTCILHAVTYLENCGLIDSGKIGIFGIDEGSALVFKASICPEIKGGITFYCGDLMGGGEEYLAYKISLDSRSYAKGCYPILINATTNESNGAFDYLSGLNDAAEDCCFCVYPGADKAVSDSQRANVELWFKAIFSGVPLPKAPDISVFCSGGALYAEVVAEDAEVKFYYAEDSPPALRYYKEVIPARAGENKYLCKPVVSDASKAMFVFANLILKNGFTLTTQVVSKQPAKLGATGEPTVKRLIYQSEEGKEGWLHPSGGFTESNALSLAEGPHGLDGIAGNSLITFKTGDTRFRGKADSLLQIIVSADEAQEIEVSVIEADEQGINEFKSSKKIAAREWTTVTLSAEDFKSVKGQSRFDRVSGIKICGKNIVLNSMLWV